MHAPTQPTYEKSPTQRPQKNISPRTRTHVQEVHGTPRSRPVNKKTAPQPTNEDEVHRPKIKLLRPANERQFFLAYELHQDASSSWRTSSIHTRKHAAKTETPLQSSSGHIVRTRTVRAAASADRAASHAEPQPGRPNTTSARWLLLRHLLSPPTVFFLSSGNGRISTFVMFHGA